MLILIKYRSNTDVKLNDRGLPEDLKILSQINPDWVIRRLLVASFSAQFGGPFWSPVLVPSLVARFGRQFWWPVLVASLVAIY